MTESFLTFFFFFFFVFICWNKGGPGCSGLGGFLTENGPLRPNAAGLFGFFLKMGERRLIKFLFDRRSWIDFHFLDKVRRAPLLLHFIDNQFLALPTLCIWSSQLLLVGHIPTPLQTRILEISAPPSTTTLSSRWSRRKERRCRVLIILFFWRAFWSCTPTTSTVPLGFLESLTEVLIGFVLVLFCFFFFFFVWFWADWIFNFRLERILRSKLDCNHLGRSFDSDLQATARICSR